MTLDDLELLVHRLVPRQMTLDDLELLVHRLVPRQMTLDDLELLVQVRIFGEFRGISQTWEASTTKRMNIDPYCQRQSCNPLNVLFNIMFLALICRDL